MAKIKSTFKNMVLVLTGISCVSALLLGGAYQLTSEPIRQSELKKKELAIRTVFPDFDNNPPSEAFMSAIAAGDSLLVYPLKKGEELVGYAVQTNTQKGFSGQIDVMVGYTLDGAVTNYSVLKHAETPGLGTKMVEWFCDSSKPKRYVVGRNPGESELSVSKDGGDIDAITAATISSRAFLDAINRGYRAIQNLNPTND